MIKNILFYLICSCRTLGIIINNSYEPVIYCSQVIISNDMAERNDYGMDFSDDGIFMDYR